MTNSKSYAEGTKRSTFLQANEDGSAGNSTHRAVANVRESLGELCPRWISRRFPKLDQRSQWAITEITGKAGDEVPPFVWSPAGRLILATSVLLISIWASIVLAIAVASGSMLLIAPLTISWLMTTSSLRSFQTTFLHHASHRNLLSVVRLDQVICSIMSILAWTLPLGSYREGTKGNAYDKGHIKGHHGKLGTQSDPDTLFVSSFSWLKPGQQVHVYFRGLIFTLASPRFHARYFLDRTRANLFSGGFVHGVMAVTYMVVLIALAVAHDIVIPVLLAWGVPLVILYQISGVLQTLTKHDYFVDTSRTNSQKEANAMLTFEQFCGRPLPDAGLPLGIAMIEWIVFSIAMCGHCVVRLCCVVGDLPSHDDHHRHARSNWANALYERRRHTADLNEMPYTEEWGLISWLKRVFCSLSKLPKSVTLGRPLSYRELDDTFLRM